MGMWGTGNFENDTSADHLSNITGRLLTEIKTAMKGKPVELEPDEFWGNAVPCNIEILTLFAEKRWVGTMLPDEKTALEWKKKFLAVYDKAELGGDARRRKVLVTTFDRFIKAVKKK